MIWFGWFLDSLRAHRSDWDFAETESRSNRREPPDVVNDSIGHVFINFLLQLLFQTKLLK